MSYLSLVPGRVVRGLAVVSAWAIFALAPGCRGKESTPSEPTRATAHTTAAVQPSAAAPAPPPYVEITTGGADAKAQLPLVIAMHGLGDRPELFIELFSEFTGKARVIALRAPQPYGEGYSWFDSNGRPREDLGVAEQMRRAAHAVAATMGKLAREKPTRGKPIVTGFSQGGMLSFALASLHPTEIRAALPISGYLPAVMMPGQSVTSAPSIDIFHGVNDKRVEIVLARNAATRLTRLGYPVQFHEYEVGHAISPEERRALYETLAKLVAAE